MTTQPCALSYRQMRQMTFHCAHVHSHSRASACIPCLYNFNLSILYAKLKHTASSMYRASITKCGMLCLQFVNPPDYSSFSFKLDDFTGAKLSPDADRTKTLRANAKSFNDIWRTGDAEVADKVLDKDVKDVNMMFGGEKDGVDSFKSMITGVFKVDSMPLFAPTCVLSWLTISKACPNCN